MARVRNPITIGLAFGIEEKRLAKLGVLNATLAIDTKLFIDPLLLHSSKHPEINVVGVKQYRERFTTIIRLLNASRARNDAAWKAAYKLFDFPEIPGTCLGYGAGSIHGSGWGPATRRRVFEVAEQIVEIGVEDPDLFTALALFEEKIGPDLLSDMTTNIIVGALTEFNARVLRQLELDGEQFNVGGTTGQFLRNPADPDTVPTILVPTDILRTLPIANDWDSVADAVHHNQQLRDRVNQDIAEIWATKSRREKAKLKAQALSSKRAFETLIKAIKSASAEPYDVDGDPDGLVRWAAKGREFADKNPLNLLAFQVKSIDDVFAVVKKIVEQFRYLVEDAGLNRELFAPDGKPRHESTAQRLFFAIAHSYCVANNIDVSPELDTGTGKVDFKFSFGRDARVLVEVKLSTNPKVLDGYRTQLEVYKRSQQTMKAIYLLIDVGRMGRKERDLLKVQEETRNARSPLSDLEIVDGTLKPTASKR